MPRPPVYIYEVVREWTTHANLCDACVKTRSAAGWTIRTRRLPPPRALVVKPEAFKGLVGELCDAALDDRTELRCEDCHLAALPACPTCGGPTVYPGANRLTLEACQDSAHEQVPHRVDNLGVKLVTKGARNKSGSGRRTTP